MSKKIVIQTAIRIGIVLVLAIAASIVAGTINKTPITDFESCAAKYPVMESYPRRCAIPGGPSFTEVIKETQPIVISPAVGSSVSGEIQIEGTAPGTWFFEGSFPVSVEDPSGNIIASGYVTAETDWMTTLPIGFKGTLKLSGDKTGPVRLVLRKDNPSGLPQNDASLSIPLISISQGNTEDIGFLVYFGKYGPDSSMAACENVVGLDRRATKTRSVGRAAMEELLKGPTEAEKSAGYFTSINKGVTIKSLTIENGTAKIDFDSEIESQIGGSCRVSAIRAQITRTLMQFPSVKKVVISVDGRTEDILQP